MPAERPLVLPRALRTLLVLVLTLGLATPALVVVGQREASAATAGDVLAEAAKHRGKAYRYGATGPANFDCSGYTGYVFRQVGISLPRTSGAQRAALPRVPNSEKRPGDLIFTHDGRGRVYHVGIYAGDEMIWHSPRTGDVVKHSRIFSRNYTVGRTPLNAGPPPPPARPASPIDARFDSEPALRAVLGAPVTGVFPVNGGSVRNHQRGQLLWSGPTGAKAVWGAIHGRYGTLRWEQGPLGFPTSDERQGPDGSRVSNFQGGKIVWTGAGGTKVVLGDIAREYNALGGANGALGIPLTEEVPVADGVKQEFAHGAVYWDRDSRRATALTGEVLAAYRAAGEADGALGMPVSVEQGGAQVRFEGGAIAYDSATRQAAVVG